MNQVANRSNTGALIEQSSLLDDKPDDWDDLSAGVAASFPILGIKGGKWHFRWKGEDTIISDARGFAVPAVNVVIVKGQKELSRTCYPPGSYVEGANSRPICWSSDGVKPDDLVEEPVNPVCATCPNDMWGSGATPAAPKAKACQQRRRLVVVPYNPEDITHELGGGPCLLSLPPSSLRNLDAYSDRLKKGRAKYYGQITQLSFDQAPNLAFPRVEFDLVQKLNDDEVTAILELQGSDQVGRILNSKINVDGPEADDGSPEPVRAPAQAATPSTGRTAPPAAPVRTNTPAIVQQVAPQMAPARETKVAAAVQPAVGAPAAKMGGFAASAVPLKAASTASTPTPITNAVNKPAAPPATQRVVRAAPQPAVEPPTPVEAVREDGGPGSLPDELGNVFDNLMNTP